MKKEICENPDCKGMFEYQKTKEVFWCPYCGHELGESRALASHKREERARK